MIISIGQEIILCWVWL